jgi:hypothetical protein
LDLEAYIARLPLWGEKIRSTVPDPDFWEIVAKPWIDGIGPAKARQYGTECWDRFGARGIAAQVFNCYCRWKTMFRSEADLPAMSDTLRDLLGFSVMMAVTTGKHPKMIHWDEVWSGYFVAEDHYQSLIAKVWDGNDPAGAAFHCFAIAWGTWELSIARTRSPADEG